MFALGIIESVHGVDAGQHGEAPEADQREEQGGDDADEESDRHHVLAVPGRAEVVLDVEGLELDVRESDPNPGTEITNELRLILKVFFIYTKTPRFKPDLSLVVYHS